jgi:hypothetical protein
MPRSKSGNTEQKVDTAAIICAIKDVISKNSKVRMVAHNFGISKTALINHLFVFQEQGISTDFEYRARNGVKNSFTATQEFEFVEDFKQAAKLRYGLTKKEAVKLIVQYGKENGVVMPESWVKNKCAGNMWLRGLRKRHETLCLRKPVVTSLT